VPVENICSIHNLEMGLTQSLAGWNPDVIDVVPQEGEPTPSRIAQEERRMRAEQPPARWALTLALAALGACTTQATPSASPQPSPVPTKAPAGIQATAPLPPPPTSIACFTRADLAGMSLVEIAAAETLCFDSEAGAQTTIPQAELTETIRTFLQDPARLVGFREMTFMGNSPSGVLPVARFEDDRGTSYLVAVVAGKVLEMNADPGLQEPGSELTQAQLQTIAEDLIRRELPAFDDLRDRLSFEVGAKSAGVNFYRWELAAAPDDGSMPPLAQVGITDSGVIFSYINTLYFLQ
jgi:hypothetical protein